MSASDDVTFRCSICSRDAGYFGLAAPGSEQSLSPSAPTIVMWGPEGGVERIQTHARVAERALAALRVADPARALFEIHPPWVSAFCPECQLSYCRAHWLISGGGADGHGRRECSCPKGHSRVLPGD